MPSLRRADRLFAILQMLRGGRLRRADDIAEALEVSVRTIYRDIADLQGHGVPVDGERGVGYLLRQGFFLPPLALSPDETDALRWGVAFVCAHGDEKLAAAARELVVKVEAGLGSCASTPLFLMPGVRTTKPVRRVLGSIREAVRIGCKMTIAYVDLDGNSTSRIIRPLNLEHWGRTWTLTGWCELRQDFRVFRLDRLTTCTPTGDRFASEAGKRFSDFLARCTDKRAPSHWKADGQ
jgi:predicted DNA-binding transcriptional regulator YafY